MKINNTTSFNTQITGNREVTKKEGEIQDHDRVNMGNNRETPDFLKRPPENLKSSLELSRATKGIIGVIGIPTASAAVGYAGRILGGVPGAAIATGLMGVAGAILGEKSFDDPLLGAGMGIVGAAVGGSGVGYEVIGAGVGVVTLTIAAMEI